MFVIGRINASSGPHRQGSREPGAGDHDHRRSNTPPAGQRRPEGAPESASAPVLVAVGTLAPAGGAMEAREA